MSRQLLPLQKLFALVKFDQDMIALQKNLDSYKSNLQESYNERLICTQGVEQAYEHKKETRKRVDLKEMEVRVHNEDVKKIRERLDAASNQREYNSANKELDEAHAKQSLLEEDLLEAWKQHEQAEQLVQDREQQCNEKVAKLDRVLEDYKQKISEVETELKEKKEERNNYLNEIPKELLDRYLIIYDRIEDPLAAVVKIGRAHV